jgi:hypothetical protein
MKKITPTRRERLLLDHLLKPRPITEKEYVTSRMRSARDLADRIDAVFLKVLKLHENLGKKSESESESKETQCNSWKINDVFWLYLSEDDMPIYEDAKHYDMLVHFTRSSPILKNRILFVENKNKNIGVDQFHGINWLVA